MSEIRKGDGTWINTSLFSPVISDGIPSVDSMYYDSWWYEQRNIIMNTGYSVGGQSITGDHYFYLNFWKIRGINKKTKRKGIISPRFLEMDHEYFHLVEKARNEDKNIGLIKGRQTGFSEKHACIIGKEFSFYPGSQSVIVSGLDKYTKTTMGFVKRGLNSLSDTEFYKNRQPNQKDYFKAAYNKVTWKGKSKIVSEAGYLSEIYAITAKNSVQAVSSLSPSFVLLEEAGVFPGVIEVFKFIKPSLYSEGMKTGMVIIAGCVCAGTKVRANDGEVLNIETLNIANGIVGYNGLGASKGEINWFNDPELKQCYRITTTGGNELECSYDHPMLFTNRKLRKYKHGIFNRKQSTFVLTENLNVGDQVAMINSVPFFGKNKVEDSRLLGLLIGDGSYTRSVELYSDDKEITDFVCSKYNVVAKPKNGIERILLPGKQKLMRKHGIHGQSKDSKRIPVDIHKFDKKSLAEFIGGYYDADGNVYYNKKKNNIRIVLTSVVRELLVEIKFQLRKFGIGSNIQYEKRSAEEKKLSPGQKDYVYRLYVNQYNDVVKFQKEITFLCNHKQKTLDLVLTLDVASNKRGDGIVDYFTNPDNPEKGEYFDGMDNIKNVRFERISKIEDIGEKLVYNLNVSETHTYLANDFITCNTGGEMDKGAEELQYIIHNPDEFDLLTFDLSEWEDDVEYGTVKMGWFCPKWKYKLVDNNGNYKKQESIDQINKERDIITDDNKRYTLITQEPIIPSEAFLIKSGGFFGKSNAHKLNKVKIQIKKTPEMRTTEVGDLDFLWDDINGRKVITGIEFTPNKDGIFEIAERPHKVDGIVPENLYAGGTDSYDKDEANTSDSKLATYIFKTFLHNGISYNTFVAGMHYRPSLLEGGSNAAYEASAKLCLYYKAKNLIEWSNIRIFDWYENHNFSFLLQERPEMMIANWIKNTSVSNRFGIDPSTKIHWLSLLNDHIKDGWFKFRMIRLIDALIKYKLEPNYNCDITIAASLAYLNAYEMSQVKRKTESATNNIRSMSPLPRYKKTKSGIITVA